MVNKMPKTKPMQSKPIAPSSKFVRFTVWAAGFAYTVEVVSVATPDQVAAAFSELHPHADVRLTTEEA